MLTTEMISKCMAGDEDAIQALVRNHQREVYQLALSVIDRGQASLEEASVQAEAAARDTFLTAIRRIGSYRQDTVFENWLFKITIEVSRRKSAVWRLERFVNKLLSRDKARHMQEMQPESAGAVRQRSDENLWNEVCTLNDRLRLPVILRYYHGFPVDRVARILGISEGVVHARLDKAREILAGSDTSESKNLQDGPGEL